MMVQRIKGHWRERMRMEKGLREYAEVLRLVRRLPKEARGYHAKYARENFVNYRQLQLDDVDSDADADADQIFHRTYHHSLWVLNKYSVDESAANRLKRICFSL